MSKAPKDGSVILAKLVYEGDGESAGIHTIKWSLGKSCWTSSLVSVPLTLENKTFSCKPTNFRYLNDK
jgi:hypothetical protein